MTKLLKIEIAVLLVLVIVAIGIRVGDIHAPGDEILQDPGNTQPSVVVTDPTQPTVPAPTDPPPTTLPPTEPPVKPVFGEDFSVEAKHWFAYHCGEERLLGASDEVTEKIWPASVTKLFTAHVALKYLDTEKVIKIGTEVNMVAPDSSIAYIKPGHKLTVAQLVEGMLLPSGNDAAYALAVAAARTESGNSKMAAKDALAYFVELMNKESQALGMSGSHWANPDGYHDFEHYTSIADLITIAKLALNNELILQCAGTVEDRVVYQSGEVANWHNTNQLIHPESQYYSPDAVGLKTGNTSYAGFSLLSAYKMDGEYIIVGAFKCQRPEDRFKSSLAVYEAVKEAYINA